MSVVNLIRINAQSGIMIADEEFWRRGSRRTLFLDNLQPLLPEKFCESSGLEAVIGLDGDPAITYEAVLQAKKHIERIIKEPDSSGRKGPIETLRDVAEITFEQINLAIRKRIDNQLRFAYGFDTNDLNRGFFEVDGKKVEIKQEKVRTDALKWTKYSQDFPRTKSLFEIHALMAGIDPKDGFQWYEWSGEQGVVMLGTGLFDSIGKGSDAASLAFIDIFRTMELQRRRQGLKAEEALLVLLESLEAAARFNHEVGGYPQIVMLDGSARKHRARYHEYSGHGAKLALEIATAYIHEHIPRDKALALIKDLVLEQKDVLKIEELFFKATPNPAALEHFLRGYKNAISTLKKEARS
ncbi:hypothetical protein JXQ70_20300 [bacterium]|nr:hypothetical protein [bacterium]